MDAKGLIVGLGNPGPEYAATRHNFGFLVVDAILDAARERKSMRLEALQKEGDLVLWSVALAGGTYLLLKPLTYMNLSGKAVARVCGRFGVQAQEVLVLHDELDLPLGRMKLKRAGGSNGHRGVDSIAEHLGTEDFLRLRLGIGRPQEFMPVPKWVLENFNDADQAAVDAVVAAAFKGIGLLFRRGLAEATQFINAFRFEEPPSEKGPVDSSDRLG